MVINFRTVVAALVLLLAALTARPARADESTEVEAQRLVHILRYVASDYGGAVANGAVASQTEYDEQLALLDDAAKIAARLQGEPRVDPAAPAVDLVAQVKKVRALVEAKSAEDAVAAAAKEVRSSVMTAFRLAEAPSGPPDRARGAALYTQHCASCHGESGRADTPQAQSLKPPPANFQDPEIADALSPLRVASTVRFGIAGTAMVPFPFLSEADRWALGFHVTSLRHASIAAAQGPTYTLAELASRSDAELRADLASAGIPDDRRAAILADLRAHAPYEDRASKSPLSLARARLDRARAAIAQGDRAAARNHVIDAYLEGIEMAEGRLRSIDASIVTAIEDRFVNLRARIESGAPPAEIDAGIDALLHEVTRAELVLDASGQKESFVSTAISSGGILLREGVEAALLIAALLGIAAQAGLADKKRWVHVGYLSAIGLGVVTWIFSSRLIALSGASRETIEGVTALLATAVLFYVSYSLLAKKEVARWMKFLRGQVSPRRAAISLFGVAFLAAYREAFETVLFYQALLATNASTGAALAGALVGAVLLVLVVAAYTRAGRFAPPQVFFKISSYLLYALAIVFAGQGVAALQLTGVIPIHALPIPSVPALGVHATVETCVAQGLLIALAIVGAMASRGSAAPAPQQAKQPS